jgi:hypothetical protein
MSQLFFLGEENGESCTKYLPAVGRPSTRRGLPAVGRRAGQVASSKTPQEACLRQAGKSREARNPPRRASETLIVAIRDSYVSRISTSSFFNQRSVFDITRRGGPVFRSSYFEFLPDTSYFVQICHFNILHSALDIRHLFTYRIS